MTLGEKILNLRKKNGISQEELSNRIGVSRQAISKWELNDSVPDIGNIIALSKLFSVSTDYLMLEDINPDDLDVRINSEKIKNDFRIKKETTNRIGYYIGVIIMIFGVINAIFSGVMIIMWNEVSDSIINFFESFNLIVNLHFLFWLFLFFGIVALMAILLGFILIRKFVSIKPVFAEGE